MAPSTTTPSTIIHNDALPSAIDLVTACQQDGDPLAAVTMMAQLLQAVVLLDNPEKTEAARTVARVTEAFQAAAAAATTAATTEGSWFPRALATAVWWHSCSNDISSVTSTYGPVGTILQSVLQQEQQQLQAAPVMMMMDHNPNGALLTALWRTVPDTKLLQAILPTTTSEAHYLSAAAAGMVDRKLRLTNTTVFYRQHKFNLLAEESEGYSKFLYVLLLLLRLHQTSFTETTAALLSSVVGIYSLDPNRCLDLTVDVLEYELNRQQQQQQHEDDNHEPCSADATATSPSRLSFLASCLRHLNSTEKLPALLGFKLRGRITTGPPSPARTAVADATASSSLLRCLTWLATYHFATPSSQHSPATTLDLNGTSSSTTAIPLLDPVQVMPYVQLDETPVTDQLESVYREYVRLETIRIQSLGRVRLGGDTEDETTTAAAAGSTTANDAAVTSPRRVQKLQQQLHDTYALQWTRQLLACGAFAVVEPVWSHNDGWSQLAVLFPDTIGVAILDWVQQQIRDWIVGAPPWVQQPSHNDDDQQSSSSSSPPTGVTIDSLLNVVAAPLEYTQESGCIALRPVLYTQLCRLLTALLQRESSNTAAQDDDFMDFLRYFLVPSLSAFSPSPALSMELWNVLVQLPYRTRYSLYRSWRGVGLERAGLASSSIPTKPLWLVQGEVQAGKDARYALKRLSKDTLRDMSRAVAKCAHGHALVVFTTILHQIESYDNLVPVMVEACRFVTPLSLDVLGYCILQRLCGSNNSSSSSSNVNRNRLKESGVNVSQWLQSLESFAGALYRRYPNVEFRGILCYLLNRLQDGHVMELGVLRKLLKSSAGWSFADYAPAASLSATQLVGRAGSTMLQRETMAFGVVDDIHVTASNQVRRVLQSDGMGVSLLILLAQVRHRVVFQSSSSGRPMPVKLIGNLVDTCQVVMAILLDFLTNSSDGKEDQTAAEIRKYAASLPSLAELHDDYKLDVASAWMLCRPLIRAATTDALYDDDDAVMEGNNDALLRKFKVTDQSRVCYQSMLPVEAWSHVSASLFEFFFSNSLRDLFCPEDVYVSEIGRLDKETERLNQKKNAPQSPPPTVVQPGSAPEKTDQEELERVKRVAICLSADYEQQKALVTSVYADMTSRASEFFVSEEVTREAAVTFFVHCIYPRCMQGPDDALYCAHFVAHMHKNETPGFSTLHFLDTLLVTLSRALYCLTEGEAACASILLLETWKMVSRWRYDDKAFDSELSGKPGSFMVPESQDADNKTVPVAVIKDDYKKLYNKWHAAIGAVCIGCLNSKEYMHLRNCLVVLTRMVEVYPTRPKLANRMLEALEPLRDESNSLADIRTSAQAYSMQLLKARDDGVWKEEDAATIRARHEMVEAAAAARQKKAEEQMAEFERDSEKITEKIGVSDGYGRDRSRGRRPDDHHGPAPSVPQPTAPPSRGSGGAGDRQDHAEDHRRRGGATAAEERRNLGLRPAPPPRDPTQRPHGGSGANDRWQRDRSDNVPNAGGGSSSKSNPALTATTTTTTTTTTGGGGAYAIMDTTRGGRHMEETTATSRGSSTLEGRWQRPDNTATNRKRSRTSSPVLEPGEDGPIKRTRREEDDGGGGRGGSRRDDQEGRSSSMRDEGRGGSRRRGRR